MNRASPINHSDPTEPDNARLTRGADETPRTDRLRGSLPLMIEREPWYQRVVLALVIAAVVSVFVAFTQLYWTPAHPGVDQNGYLVGAKQLAARATTGLTPPDDDAFVGRMWVGGGATGTYYPKYPLGLPILVAIVIKIGGPSAAYWINPILMAAALGAICLLARAVAGSFAGALAMLMVASSPVTLALANNPNSHASALCFVCWGLCFLIGWWQRPTWWRATLAGGLLGYAAIIRYTEGLLILPILAVILFNLRWNDHRSWGQSALLLGAWAAPLVLQLAYNLAALGSLTGYAPTNESSAFETAHFQRNWEILLRQINSSGLFLVFPIGLLGLVLLLARNWRLALVLWAWLVPGLIAYGSYYWAIPDENRIGTLRFYLTLFPAIAIGAAWCLTRVMPQVPPTSVSNRMLRWVVAPFAALLIVIGAAAYNLWSAVPLLESDHRKSLAVAEAARRIIDDAKAPAGSIVFGPELTLNHLQFVADYRLYQDELFNWPYVRSLERIDKAAPSGLQPSRAHAIVERARARMKNPADNKEGERALAQARDLAAKALDENRRVFALVGTAPWMGGSETGVRKAFSDALATIDRRSFDVKTRLRWSDPELKDASNRRFGEARPADRRQDLEPMNWQLVEIVRK